MFNVGLEFMASPLNIGGLQFFLLLQEELEFLWPRIKPVASTKKMSVHHLLQIHIA